MSHKALIFPSGAENAIELYDSLRYSPHFDVFGATSIKDRSSLIYDHDRLLFLPFIGKDNFITSLNELIARHKIEIIFPTHDSVMLELARGRNEINAIVCGCDLHTAELCRNKDKLYEFFAGESFIPRWNGCGNLPDAPIFLKPVNEQGGHGCRKIDAPEVLSQVPEGMMLCEFLPGPEYTIDCFTDRHGRLLFAGPRSRSIIRNGVAFRSEPVAYPRLNEIAGILNARLDFRGLWFFQVKETKDGEPKLLEISSRIATSMGLCRQRGVNLPLMTAYDALGADVRVLSQNFPIRLERVMQTIFEIDVPFSTAYVDYDDTLVVNDAVNANLLKVLYQISEKGKNVILLTRHKGNIEEELARRKICKDLFDAIIHLAPEEPKAGHVKKDAIYIDNMFHDRLSVAEQVGIAVFDVDAVQALASH